MVCKVFFAPNFPIPRESLDEGRKQKGYALQVKLKIYCNNAPSVAVAYHNE